MKPAFQFASLCSIAVLLAACGGSNSDSPSPKATVLGSRIAQGAQHAPAEYTQAVQSIYIGFFGRPADAKGLEFWNRIFSDRNLPTTLPELITAYAADGQASSALDGFAASQEFGDLYVRNNSSLVNAIYLNGFNRNAELSGIQYWAGFLDRKEIAPAQAVLRILSGAQNEDALVVSKKIQAATIFTSLLDTPDKVSAYESLSNNQAARDLLASITATTDMTAFRDTIVSFIAAMQGEPPFPMVSRYAGFNYLQDLSTNTPLYGASYSYLASGVLQPLGGSLTYGLTAQTIKFYRNAAVLSYDAPVVAAAGIGNGVLPSVNMLCQNVSTPAGSIVKSTDVLVTRAAVQLLSAADLANQTFTVYRENCATGGNNLKSMSFDSQGNGTFPLSSGVLTFNAVAVTQILNGQTQPDLSTGKLLGFTAYRYPRTDGSNAYVIIQHLANHKVDVTDGILAVWSQE